MTESPTHYFSISTRYLFAFLGLLVATLLAAGLIWSYLFSSIIGPIWEYRTGGCTSDFWPTIFRNGIFMIGGTILLIGSMSRIADLARGNRGSYHVPLIILAILMFAMSWYHTTIFPIAPEIIPAALPAAKEYLVLAHWDFGVSTPANTCNDLWKNDYYGSDPIHIINQYFLVVAVYLALAYPVMQITCRPGEDSMQAQS